APDSLIRHISLDKAHLKNRRSVVKVKPKIEFYPSSEKFGKIFACHRQVILFSMANLIRLAVEVILSFLIIFFRCTPTVCGLMYRPSAISVLDLAMAISFSTSVSRRVRPYRMLKDSSNVECSSGSLSSFRG